MMKWLLEILKFLLKFALKIVVTVAVLVSIVVFILSKINGITFLEQLKDVFQWITSLNLR